MQEVNRKECLIREVDNGRISLRKFVKYEQRFYEKCVQHAAVENAKFIPKATR
jgi:hypothetical protein